MQTEEAQIRFLNENSHLKTSLKQSTETAHKQMARLAEM